MPTREEMLKIIHKLRVGSGITGITDEEMLDLYTKLWEMEEERKE